MSSINPLSPTMLELGAFLSEQEKAWQAVSKEYFILERRQAYQHPGNPSWEAFAQGDMHRAIELMNDSLFAQQHAKHAAAINRGAYLLRVRVVQFPIANYLRWAFESYFSLMRLGEEIRIIEVHSIEDLEENHRLKDFQLFDQQLALLPDYGTEGNLQGGRLVNESKQLDKLQQLVETLIDRSELFSEYYARLKERSDTLSGW